jgi:DNA-binding CsgD family transcriptional regulator
MHTAVEMYPTSYVQDILQLVDRIYAAAFGETRWEQTLAGVCLLGKLDGCALSMVDPLQRRRVMLAACGLGSASEPNAMLGPMPGNPQLTDTIFRPAPGTVWQNRQITSDARSNTTSLWTDWMRAKGFVSSACVIVGRDEGQLFCLEVYAGAGRASGCPELDHFLRQLVPHLSRAWRFGRTHPSTLATTWCSASPSHSHTDAVPAPDLAALPGVVRLRAEFGLTKAEARLALRLAEGSSLASAARAFNVKLTTVRSQLQQVFAKTGTSRQTELVALLLNREHVTRGPLWSLVNRERQAAARTEPRPDLAGRGRSARMTAAAGRN